jgi:two-component system OmpR family sensor kinase
VNVHWLSRRTLRWKLTTGLLVLLLATCTLVGVVTAVSLRGFLVGRLDDQLALASGRFGASLEHGGGGESEPDGDADNAVPGQSVGTLGVRLLDGRVTQAAVVLDNGNTQTLRLSPADQATLAHVPVGADPRTVNLDDLGDYRVLATMGRDQDVQLTGLPLQPIEDTVTRLLAVEAGLFAVIVIGGAVASAALVRLTLRPLNQVAADALDVSELPLASGKVALPKRDRALDPGTEVGQVSVAFTRMLDHVETALGARDETEQRLRRFIADASHELRTPLATIRSHAEYARRTGAGLPESIQHAVGRVEAEAVRMGVLVDDLLLLAELDAGRPMARDPVDLTRLALDATSDARRSGPDHQWRLDLPEEVVETVGDASRLQQVLANLLANARTHTPAGTTVTVRLWRDRDVVGIEVSDDGPGIPADLLPTLFERFSRGDLARSRATGNTGLGLAIAFGIVAAHHGTLTAQSHPGATTFRIRLPARPE